MTNQLVRAGAGIALVAGTALGAGGLAWAQEDDGAPPGEEESQDERAARRAAFEAFEDCLAEHGLEVPVPEGTDIDTEAAEAAYQACKDLVPPPPGVSEEEFREHQAAFDAYRECLGEQGVEAPVPIPMILRGGHGPRPEGDPQEEEALEAARDACADLRPEPLRDGPGGCGGPGGPGRPPEGDQEPEGGEPEGGEPEGAQVPARV